MTGEVRWRWFDALAVDGFQTPEKEQAFLDVKFSAKTSPFEEVNLDT